MINKSFKILVIIFFLTLIVGFVIYRSGKITSILPSSFSLNSFINNNDTPEIDSAQAVKNRMMFSSKSMILSDIKLNKDSFSQNNDDSSIHYMGGSKSLTMIPPTQILKFKLLDTVSNKTFLDSFFPKK